MRINTEVIETRWFPSNHLLIEGYLDGLINDMLECNDDIIKLNRKGPEFQVKMKAKSAAAIDWSMVEGPDDAFLQFDVAAI